jgi:hypothetical protein
MSNTNKVQGYALYAEIGRDDKTSLVQFFVTPDGYTEAGQFIPARLYYRQLHSHAPKRQWRVASMNDNAVVNLIESGTSLDVEQALEFATKRLSDSFSNLLGRILNGHGWKIINKPLVVEVSQKDMKDIAVAKTPSKVIYRIQQVKKGTDFPDALVVSR